jgi:hypothetical protein
MILPGSLHLRSYITAAGFLLLLVHAAPSPAIQQTILVGTMGSDTIAVDRFIRDSTSLTGAVFIRRPTPHTINYKATLAPPRGRFTYLELIWRDSRGAEFRRSITSYGIDSIRTQLRDGTVVSYSAAVDLDAVPLPPRADMPHAYSILEHVGIALLAPAGPAATQIPWFASGSNSIAKHRVRRVRGDTVQIDFPAGPVRMHMGSDKRLQWMSIGISPVQTFVQRSDKDIDIAKLAASFAGRDSLRR